MKLAERMPYAKRAQFTLVAFTGQDGAGKSTAAQMLTEHTGWPVQSFASPLKAILREVDPIVHADVLYPGTACDCCQDMADVRETRLTELLDAHEGDERTVKDEWPEYRELLRDLGEAIKVHQPDYFADAWLRAAASHRNAYHYEREGYKGGIIADDLRFPVEWEAMERSCRGYNEQAVLVRVVNPRTEGGEHASQTQQEQLLADIVIHNDGTLDDLAREVELLHTHLRHLAQNPGWLNGSR